MNVYEAKNGHSIVRVTLEGMTHNIVAALTNHDMQQEQYVREALEKFCKPENLRVVLGEAVDRVLKKAINEEIEAFYSHGEGRAKLRAAVAAKLSEKD